MPVRAFGFLLLFASACGQSTPAGGTAVPGSTAMPGAPVGLPPGVPATAVPGMPGASAMPGMPGGAPNPFAVLGQLGQMAQAMQGMTAQGGAVPLVNFRELANAIPAAVPGFQPDGDLDGSTGAMGAIGGSEARRRFRGGEKRLSIKIVDTSFNQLLVMPFTMARGVVVDSTDQMQRASDVAGQPGFLEYRYRDRRSQQTILASGRFIVEVSVEPAASPEEATSFAGLVNFPLLAQLHAASQAAAATAAPGTAAP